LIKSINFLTDSWCSNDSLVSKLDLDPTTLLDAKIKVNEFITMQKPWKLTKLRSYLLDDLVQLIQGIPPPYTEVTGSFCWAYTGSSDVSTKCSTRKIHDNFSKEQPIWQYNWIWQLDVLLKIKIFLWQHYFTKAFD